MSDKPRSNGLSGHRHCADAGRRPHHRQDPHEDRRQAEGKADRHRAPDLHDREAEDAQSGRRSCSSRAHAGRTAARFAAAEAAPRVS